MAAVGVLTAVVAPGRIAHAATDTTTQTAPSGGAPVGMHLAYQTPWVGLHGQFTMLLHIDDPRLKGPNAAIAVTIHERADTRSGFDDVLANRNLGGIIDEPDRIPVSSLGRLGNNYAVTLGLPGSDAQTLVSVRAPGAYPVEVSLIRPGTPTTPFVTWLVVVDDSGGKPIDKPLLVSWIWQLVANPAAMPDGGLDPSVVQQLRPGGRLDRIATLLARAGSFPYSLVAGPETVETWSKVALLDPKAAPGLARVRAAARRPTTGLLPVTYVPIDPTVLEGSGLGDELPKEYAKGRQTLDAVLRTSPPTQSQTTFVDPADDPVIDQLRRMPITRVAVRDASLQPVSHPFTPAQGFVLVSPEGRSAGVATAPFIEDLLRGSDPPALKAARVVAALAEIAYETPAISRGVVVAPPADWSPDVSAMVAIVNALRDFPLVQNTTLDNLFSQISTEEAGGADVERRLQTMTPAPASITLDEYAAAEAQLRAYAAVVGDNDSIVVEGSDALATALSTTISSERAHALLARVNVAITAFADSVTVDAKRVTLTASRANIPLSFENKLKPPRPIRVVVHLDSPKLSFPKGADELITLGPGTTTHAFTVEARTSGTFPMTISLTSQDGQLQFGPSVRVTVRSAVFGGFAVALTVAALVFLAGWWGNHIRRTRRARRAVPAGA